MDRFLVAFERPSASLLQQDPAAAYEAAWDAWVGALHRLGLRLPADLDPVSTSEGFEIYEAVRL